MKEIHRLFARFSFCLGIGMDQITPELKFISWWEVRPFYIQKNDRFQRPKMYNVKPQPFKL